VLDVTGLEGDGIRVFTSSSATAQCEWSIASVMPYLYSATAPQRKSQARCQELKQDTFDTHEKLWPGVAIPKELVSKVGRKGPDHGDAWFSESTYPTSLFVSLVVMAVSHPMRRIGVRTQAGLVLRSMVNAACAIGLVLTVTVPGTIDPQIFRPDTLGFAPGLLGVGIQRETFAVNWNPALLDDRVPWV
jgi:hypothetical protein